MSWAVDVQAPHLSAPPSAAPVLPAPFVVRASAGDCFFSFVLESCCAFLCVDTQAPTTVLQLGSLDDEINRFTELLRTCASRHATRGRNEQ